MGDAETTGAPVERPFLDARQAPLGVAVGAQIRRSGGGGRGGGRGRDVGDIVKEEKYKGSYGGQGRGTVSDQVGGGGGVSASGFPRWIPCGGSGLAGGGPGI